MNTCKNNYKSNKVEQPSYSTRTKNNYWSKIATIATTRLTRKLVKQLHKQAKHCTSKRASVSKPKGTMETMISPKVHLLAGNIHPC